jgi:hypothetical protein
MLQLVRRAALAGRAKALRRLKPTPLSFIEDQRDKLKHVLRHREQQFAGGVAAFEGAVRVAGLRQWKRPDDA